MPSSATSQTPAPPSDTTLRDLLLSRANPSGGWAYYAGKSSRLEPTCWNLLALLAAGAPASSLGPHAGFLARAQRPTGWLLEDSSLPPNISFNALAAFTWLSAVDLASADRSRRLLAMLVMSKGVPAPQNDAASQDNSLRGWPWNDATFSWVEPTAWGLLALKKARRLGVALPGAAERIAEAERLLIDRACKEGGWNYGNAVVMHQDLRPYVVTTALVLLALQDRRGEAVVARGLAHLEAHWSDEVSAVALGLTLLCLEVYGRPLAPLEARLVEHFPRAMSFGNLHGLAVIALALSRSGRGHAFRL